MPLGTCTLDQIAECHLGFKSLQNLFFYVDQEIVDRYAIEPEFLVPIVRLADINKNSYWQDVTPSTFLFFCKKSEHDLRGTGALKYIRGMANQPAGKKRQANRPTTIRNALSEQSGGDWYAPKATPHASIIWLRKAVSGVFAPMLFKGGAAVDQRCNYVEPLGGISHQLVASVLTSSIFALAAESLGAASMGAGVLELPTRLLRTLPVPDVRTLNTGDGKQLQLLAKKVWRNQVPVDWSSDEPPGSDLQELDDFLLKRMDAAVTTDRLYAEIQKTVATRFRMASTKTVVIRAAEQRDISAVADSTIKLAQQLLESRKFPDDSRYSAKDSAPIDLNFDKPFQVGCEPFLGESNVEIHDSDGQTLFSQTLNSASAQVLVKALQLGRRVFSVPLKQADAERELRQLFEWLPKVLEGIRLACAETATGTRYEAELYDFVLESLKVHRSIDTEDSFGTFSFE